MRATQGSGSELWGFIDRTGQFVIKPQFAGPVEVGYFQEGYAGVTVDGKVGYIDRSGSFAIQPTFPQAYPFHEGMAVVITEGPCMYFASRPGCGGPQTIPYEGTANWKELPQCKFAFIDKTGKMITDQRFDDAGWFAEGMAPVKVGRLWGYIDASGTLKIAPKFESAEPFSDGIALVQEGGLFGYISHDGSYVVQPQFKSAEGFVDGRAVVQNDRGYIYIDHTGTQAFPGEFWVASSFFKGLAHVELLPKGKDVDKPNAGQSYAYIDKTGRRIFSYYVDPPRDDE